MNDKKEDLKEFFNSLQALEGFEEDDLLEIGEYLGFDQVSPTAVNKNPDPKFQMMSEFMNSMKALGTLSEDDLLEILNYLDEGEEKIPEILIKETEEGMSKDIRVMLSKMKLPQKVKMGMFGNAACRAILITNGNRLVQMSVLKNPKIQEKEILDFAQNANMSKDVLRIISDNRQWMSSYQIKYLLVCNPKTPLDISTKWLRYINASDLKKISRSKNIPAPIVTQAKKRVEIAQRKS